MGRIKKSHIALFSYIICLFCVIIVAFLFIQRKIDKSLEFEQKRYVALLDENEFSSDKIVNDISLWTLEIESRENIIYEFISEIKKEILRISSFSLIFFAGITAIFICFYKKNQKKQLLKDITKYSIKNKDIQSKDEIADAVYIQISNEIENKIKDYQQMNSYLAHEQKNLLGIIFAKVNKEKDTKSLLVLKKIHESIEDFLTVSDYDTSDISTVDVSLIAAEVCDSYADIYEKLQFEFDEDQNYEIKAKERWIYRAISNLVDNAIKFGCDDFVKIHIKKQKGSVIISVKDYGTGISDENIEKIWENRVGIRSINEDKRQAEGFGQKEEKIKTREESLTGDGYGIGLSLVAHVCEMCSGYYYVQSKIGEGSTFILSFPSE